MKANNKIVIGVVLCTAWMMGVNAALAGEVNGKGDPVPGGENGRSLCSFSGQQDGPDNEGIFRSDGVQSWGQIFKFIRDALPDVFHPGVGCNPNRPNPPL